MEYVELQGLVIVLMGSFTPVIFNPDWLAKQGVISDEEAAEARVEVIHPELAQFTVGDLIFDVNAERFALHVTAEPFVRAADIIADLFNDKLSHTPLSALGINYIAHFRVQNWEQQTKLGRALAPLEPWGNWGDAFEGDALETVGGLVSLTMQMSSLKDRAAGNMKVVIQPSNRIMPAGTGVFMQVNDHYEAAEGKAINFAELCLTQLTPSLERSKDIVGSMCARARAL